MSARLPFLVLLLCSISLVAPAKYAANINDDPAFQARLSADRALLAGDFAAARETYARLVMMARDDDARYLLAGMADAGLGGPEEVAAARKHWEHAAGNGHAPSLRALYQSRPDHPDAGRWLQQAVAGGDPRAQALAAQIHFNAGEHGASLALARRAAAAGNGHGRLLLGLLAHADGEAAGMRHLHRVLNRHGREPDLVRRAARVLYQWYFSAGEDELAFFFAELAQSSRPPDATALEHGIEIDTDRLRTRVGPIARDSIRERARAWQAEHQTTEPALAAELRRFTAPQAIDCEALNVAMDTAVSAAKVGRSAAEIERDVQNYLPLRDASHSAQITRLYLARELLQDFSQVGETPLARLRTMIVGKCEAGGYLPH